MKYYISKYNFYIGEDNSFYIYNAVSGIFLRLSHKLYSYIKQNDYNNTPLNSEVMSGRIVTLLKNSNIIYLSSDEERSYLEYLYLHDTYDDSFLSLVLLPSLKCNLGCHYCYEKDKRLILTNNELNCLKNFFKNQVQKRRYIAVRWSGGEILTSWKTIRELSMYIIEQCKLHNCSFVASAISNGTLLTKEIIDEMLEYNIKSLQITFDGDRECHNEVRKFKDGTGTYDKIMHNIELASKKLKVIIRINLDKKNFNTIENLFRDLSSSNVNRQNIQLFCKPVICTNVRTPQNDTFTQKEFYDIELALLDLSQKYNLPYSFHWGVKGRNTRCAYSGIQGFYLTPDLKLYKCPIYLDQGDNKDNSVGYINSEGEMLLSNYSELMKSLSYSPFNNEECSQCKVLPICHGKCPILWENSGRIVDSGCIAEKYTIEEKIRYAIRNRIQMNAYNNSGII